VTCFCFCIKRAAMLSAAEKHGLFRGRIKRAGHDRLSIGGAGCRREASAR
jgi:hypothetical protein